MVLQLSLEIARIDVDDHQKKKYMGGKKRLTNKSLK
jgi:hypothetical protein